MCSLCWHRSGGVHNHRVCHTHLTDDSINPTLWLLKSFSWGCPHTRWPQAIMWYNHMFTSSMFMWDPIYVMYHLDIFSTNNEIKTFLWYNIHHHHPYCSVIHPHPNSIKYLLDTNTISSSLKPLEPGQHHHSQPITHEAHFRLRNTDLGRWCIRCHQQYQT